MNTSAWGIDLGTTNSCIARARGDGVEVIAIDEALTVPSVLAYDGREFLVGRRAANHAVIAPDQAVRSIKRQMGDAAYRVKLGGTELSPIDVSARILEYLKTHAERATGEKVGEAVITVPAWFNEPQRRATVEAGVRAGLKVTRIVNEPTAAGLAYGHTGASKTDAAEPSPTGERWLVYDLGGGTFDVSILSVAGNYKEVLASCGNTYLGGDDFDHRIVLRWVDLLRDRYSADVSQDRVAMAQLRHLAEQAKIRLSRDVEARAESFIDAAGKRLPLEDVLTRTQFATLIEDYVESTIAKARQALEEAHVSAQQLSRVLLVGGSTRIPRIQQRVAQEFGIEPDAFVDVDLSVALGAAIQSALDHSLSSAQIVVDIAPHALGVAALGAEDELALERAALGDDDTELEAVGYPRTFVPVIRKNARLPAKFVEQFYTAADGQNGVDVVVLQGESRNTRENTLVGAFHAAFEPRPARSVVCIGFEYDRNGMVRVSVSEQGSAKVLKSHTLDLSRSAESNSEARSLHRLARAATDRDTDDWQDVDDADDWDDTDASGRDAGAMGADESSSDAPNVAHLTNFLIEQVERQLSGVAADELPDIRAALAEYRELLAAGRDDEIDDVEERLYAWLDSAKAGT